MGTSVAYFGVVFAVYPRATQLDFTGPYEVFARLRGAQCVLASAAGGDIEADGGLAFTKVRRLAEVERCALICRRRARRGAPCLRRVTGFAGRSPRAFGGLNLNAI